MILFSVSAIASIGMLCCLWRKSILGFLLGAYFFSQAATIMVFFMPGGHKASGQVYSLVILLGSFAVLLSGMAMGVRLFYRQRNIGTEASLIKH